MDQDVWKIIEISPFIETNICFKRAILLAGKIFDWILKSENCNNYYFHFDYLFMERLFLKKLEKFKITKRLCTISHLYPIRQSIEILNYQLYSISFYYRYLLFFTFRSRSEFSILIHSKFLQWNLNFKSAQFAYLNTKFRLIVSLR